MKRSELNKLKQNASKQGNKARDLESLVARLLPLLSTIKKLLPAEVVAILEKYQKED